MSEDGLARIERCSVEHVEEFRNANWEHAFYWSCQGNPEAYEMYMKRASECCLVLAYMERNRIPFIEKHAMFTMMRWRPISIREASGISRAEAEIAARPKPSKSIGYFRKLVGQIFGGML